MGRAPEAAAAGRAPSGLGRSLVRVLTDPVHLCGDLWQVAGSSLTHPYDAAGYLWLGEGGPLLVDCGSGLGHARLLAGLAFLDVVPSELTCVLATHGHFDHVSGVARLRADGAPGLPLLLAAEEHEAVEAGCGVRTAARLLYDQPFPPLRVDGVPADGPLASLPTPGHSPGSTSFLVEAGGRRVLLAGDALWGGFHPLLGSDMAAWHRSLAALVRAAPDAMSFGHGVHHLVEDAAAKIAAAAQRLGWLYDPWFERPSGVSPSASTSVLSLSSDFSASPSAPPSATLPTTFPIGPPGRS